jgi:ligand-binding sensor domain-containing protein
MLPCSPNKKVVIKLLFCCVMFFSIASQGQPAIIKIFPLHDGNLQPRINCLVQPSKGYLLAGTSNGLFIFNGIQFEKVEIDSSIHSQQVTALCEVKPGEIWIGFQNGALARYTFFTATELKFEEGRFGKPITKIIKDSSKNIWCSTAGEGVYLYNGNHWINFGTDDGMSDAYVYDMALAGNSGVVCGTDDGVNALAWLNKKKVVRKAAAGKAAADKIIRRIVAGSNETYLAGTQSAHMGIFSIKNLAVESPGVAPIHTSQVNGLARTLHYNWIATESDGLFYYNPVMCSDTPCFSRLAIPQKKITGVLADKQQNIWLYADNELLLTNGDKLMKVNTGGDSSYRQLHAMSAGTTPNTYSENIWYGYKGGLKEIRNDYGKQSLIDHPIQQFEKNTEVTSLYDDSTGRIWIGTMGKGIWLFNKNTNRTSALENILLSANSNILTINGKQNAVWITSLEGIVKATLLPGNTLHFESYNNREKIGSNYVYSIFTDSKNRTWFATDGRGLTKLENGVFTNYAEKDGIKTKVIYGIAEDRNGCIWMNTLNDGLYCYNGKMFINVSVKNGLSDNNIASIVSDKNGNIVALSKKAIDVIDVSTNAIQTFDEDQDLHDLNTDLHSTAVSPDGILYFSTAPGIYALQPLPKIMGPVAYIDHAELFLTDFNIDSVNEFSADENNLGIHFNAIDLDHPAKVQFQYLLEAFNATWISTKDRYVNFPKLTPGHYTFRVRASLSNNFTLTPEVSYSFTINKPFWQRSWFIVFCVLAIAGLIWLVVRYREKQQKRWQDLKQEKLQSQLETLKSQVNPHFFFNSLNTLVALIEEEPKAAVNYTNHLSDFFRKMVQYRFRDVIPLDEELDMIKDYFYIQQQRFSKSLQLNNHIDLKTATTRQVAPLTLQLLVENAIKHNTFTIQHPLLIEIYTDDEWLIVSNNLKPKLHPETGEGMGLQNIIRRYKLLTWKDVIIEKNGDWFKVKIPLM